MISKDDVLSYEKQFGIIPQNSFVIRYTGWSQYWSHPLKYRNLDKEGHMHIPGCLPEAVEILISRKIVGIGIDTLSPDGSDMTFPIHHLLICTGKYIVKNLANCHELPPNDAYIIVCPLKIEQVAESPIRKIGLILIFKEKENVI